MNKIEAIMEDMLKKAKEIDQEGLCLGLFTIQEILKKHLQKLTAVKGVDELVEKRENTRMTLAYIASRGCVEDAGKYKQITDCISDLKALKHTPVNDSQPKEVNIKRRIGKSDNGDMYIYGDCTCGDMVLSEFDKYCSRCGSKINWIA